MKRFFPVWSRKAARRTLTRLFGMSLEAAAREQGLGMLRDRLRRIVPDLSDQYSDFQVAGDWLEPKVRTLHAFQVSLIERVRGEFPHPTIVDIGDSSGTHIRYLRALAEGAPIKSLSVNLDHHAVERIRAKGLDAVHARAEELEQYNVSPDIFLCFETLEHLSDPIGFLHSLAQKTTARYLVLTVPYVAHSRVALRHIREQRKGAVSAERTHIFEFSPTDLRLIAQHAGWAIADEQIYLQYPRWHPLRVLQPLWRQFDCEGFYGMILKRDDTWSKLYADW